MRWSQQYAFDVVVVTKTKISFKNNWESQHDLLNTDYVNELALD